MARTRCPFTQEAMTRVFKAAAAAGVSVKIEIEDSKMIVSTGFAPTEVEPPSLPPNKIVL
jgi:hypothetical protein